MPWIGQAVGLHNRCMSLPFEIVQSILLYSALSIKCYCSFRQYYLAPVFSLYFYVILIGELSSAYKWLLLYLHYWKFSIFDLQILYETFGIVCRSEECHTLSIPQTWEGYYTHYKNHNVSQDMKKEEKPQGRFPRRVLKVVKIFITTKLPFSFVFYRNKNHHYWWTFLYIFNTMVLKHWSKIMKGDSVVPWLGWLKGKTEVLYKGTEIKALKLTLKCR